VVSASCIGPQTQTWTMTASASFMSDYVHTRIAGTQLDLSGPYAQSGGVHIHRCIERHRMKAMGLSSNGRIISGVFARSLVRCPIRDAADTLQVTPAALAAIVAQKGNPLQYVEASRSVLATTAALRGRRDPAEGSTANRGLGMHRHLSTCA
jgi:hypothetical protein